LGSTEYTKAIPEGICEGEKAIVPRTTGKENWTNVPDEEADPPPCNGVPDRQVAPVKPGR
jgi:hypothetical protein